MKVRFLADYDFNQEIVDGLLRRESSIDIKTGFDAGLQGIPDPEVLRTAAEEGRGLVTHDHRTMQRHFAEFVSRRHCTGVFIVPQRIEIAAAIAWFRTNPGSCINGPGGCRKADCRQS